MKIRFFAILVVLPLTLFIVAKHWGKRNSTKLLIGPLQKNSNANLDSNNPPKKLAPPKDTRATLGGYVSQIAFSDQAKTEVKTCFNLGNQVEGKPDDKTFDNIKRIDGLLPKLAERFGSPLRRVRRYENTLLRLTTGEERRVRITFEDESQHLQYYGVDDEGLPIPLKIPANQRTNPTPEFVASILKGVIFKTQSGETLFYKEGSADIESEDRRIKFFHFSSEEFSLGCDETANSVVSCKCLTQMN